MKLTPHRILLVVSSMKKALRFYRDILGFHPVSDTRRRGPCYDEITGIKNVIVRVVFLAIKACSWQIELVEYLRPKSEKRIWHTNDIGAVRLCFMVDNLTVALGRLKEKRVRSLRGPVHLEKDGRRVARILLVTDPDGYQLELRQPERSEAKTALPRIHA